MEKVRDGRDLLPRPTLRYVIPPQMGGDVGKAAYVSNFKKEFYLKSSFQSLKF